MSADEYHVEIAGQMVPRRIPPYMPRKFPIMVAGAVFWDEDEIHEHLRRNDKIRLD